MRVICVLGLAAGLLVAGYLASAVPQRQMQYYRRAANDQERKALMILIDSAQRSAENARTDEDRRRLLDYKAYLIQDLRSRDQ